MLPSLTTRPSEPGDLALLRAIYAETFPDEDLFPIVEELVADPGFGVCSLVALSGDRIIGHIAMTPCRVGDSGDAAALLGPLGVRPDTQRQGAGGALIRAGCDAMKTRDIPLILVLGDPTYYGRFGFRSEADVETPCPIPDAWKDAWQSLYVSRSGAGAAGKLQVPPPWRDPALWSS